MATPSSILAWRIPGTEEPSGLLSMGSHRVGHNWSDLAAAREIYIYKGNLHLWGCLPFCGFLGGSVVKNGPPNAEDMGLMLGSERSPAEGNGNLLQYFCLENPMDRGAWRATVHGIAKSQTWLSMHAPTHSQWSTHTVTNGASSLIPVYHAFPGHLPQLVPQLFNIFILSLAEDSYFRWWLGLCLLKFSWVSPVYIEGMHVMRLCFSLINLSFMMGRGSQPRT